MAKYFLLFLILILSISVVYSEQIFPQPTSDVQVAFNEGKGRQGVNVFVPKPTVNFSMVMVNASEIWLTNLGALDNANATQFDGTDNQLNIKESWLTSFGNKRWLELDGSNFFTDNLIQYDGSLFNFSIDKAELDTTINLLGYNHTSNLTEFYGLRYLT